MRTIRLASAATAVVLGLGACAASFARPPTSSSTTPREPPAKVQRIAVGGQAGASHARPAAGSHRDAAGFSAWVARFRRRARQRGVDRQTLDSAFDNAVFVPRIIAFDRRQPEFNRPIWDYLDTAVSATRVRHGRARLAAHRDVFGSVAQRYGVARYIIGAIWGIESNYGHNVGHYQTIDALATLGYDGRRADFAEHQLYAALNILAEGDIRRDRMRGSWAGAMGQCQFLPTSFLTYAVDANGDGRRNIWSNTADVAASIANYLVENGWRTGSPWGREVVLGTGFDYALADGKTRHSSDRWRTLGVHAVDNRGLPSFAAAAIVAPAGARGPAFMVGPNFRAILRYNNATSYALAVGLLADRLAGRPGVRGHWPRQLRKPPRAAIRRMQAKLNALGYASGTPDGIVGPATRAGVRAFQRAHGLTADGYPTLNLVHQIAAAAH